MAVVEALRTWLVQQEAQGGRIMQDVVPVLGFEKSTEAYDYFSEMFGSEMPTWTLEQLRSWLHEHGHTRYEDITDAVMQEAYEASIA